MNRQQHTKALLKVSKKCQHLQKLNAFKLFHKPYKTLKHQLKGTKNLLPFGVGDSDSLGGRLEVHLSGGRSLARLLEGLLQRLR